MMRNFFNSVVNVLGYYVIGGVLALGGITVYKLYQHYEIIKEESNVILLSDKVGAKFGTFVTDSAPKKYKGIIRLHDPSGRFYCTGFVIDASYAMTAAHCLVSEFGGLSDDDVFVHSSVNQETGVKAKPVAANTRMDYGLIHGDFSEFEPMNVDFTSQDFFNGDTEYTACGFPMGQKDLVCYPIKPTVNYGFGIKSVGHLYPGQSGGPVINVRTGRVVGLNSAAISEGDGGVISSVLVGALASFGIEP